jgi:hypothetical protein
MISIDYFLYDNRTLSTRWGRDWGIKAATGVLADRSDLKTVFERYCGAIPGEQGRLIGFGAAIGAVRERNGCLLCITLECSDSYNRRSWSVFGLWCPDASTLEQVLAGDPVASAKVLLDGSLPDAVEIYPRSIDVSPRRRGNPYGIAFHRFDPATTVLEVTSILLGALRAKAVLPNILGITATSRLPALASQFDLVYCHPMDERTERVLTGHLSPPEPEEPWPAPIEPAAALPLRGKAARSMILQSGTIGGSFLQALAISVGLMVLVLVIILIDAQRTAKGKLAEWKPETSSQARSIPSANPQSPGVALREIEKRLWEFKNLDPVALRNSTGFRAAEDVEVIPARTNDRKRLQAAYKSLLDLRDRMVKGPGNYVAYYFDEEDGRRQNEAMKLRKIGEVLREHPPCTEDCVLLKKAFGFEFDDADSVVRQW